MKQNELGLTMLHLILRVDKHNYNLIKKVVEVGGRQLIMKKCPSGWNGLCTAYFCDAPTEVTDLLFDFGGIELLMEKNNSGSTVLERVILMKSNDENLISKIINIGGRQLINARNDFGLTIIELVLRTRPRNCKVIMETIVNIAGKDIIIQTNEQKMNALHFACLYNASTDIIELFLRVGGHEKILMQEDNFGSTPLLLLPSYDNIWSIRLLLQEGGKDLVMKHDHAGFNILHKVCRVKNGKSIS